MAAATKLLWLNGGIAQSLGTTDTVDAAGVWTFDASGGTGTTTFSGPLSASAGKFVVDSSGNVDASGNLTVDASGSFGGNLAVTGTLGVSGVSLFSNDVSITGDLTVNGDIISRGQIDVVVKDAFLDLSFGNTTIGTQSQASSSGGFTVTQARNQNFIAGQVTAFPTSTSFTYADASGSTALQAGDVVAITGLPQELAENEGFFVVASVDGATFPQTVTIESSPAASLPWMQTAFQDGTPSSAGSAYKANISVLAIADGTTSFKSLTGSAWPVGTLVLASYVGASAAGATKALFQANGAYIAVGAGSTTLQNAYDNGQTITTNNAKGNVVITGDQALYVTASGGIDLSGAALTITNGAVDIDLDASANFVVNGDPSFPGYFYVGVTSPVGAWELHASGNATETAVNIANVASSAHTLRATAAAMTVAGNSLVLDASGAAAAITALTAVSATAPRVFLDASGAQLDASGDAVAIDASASITATAPRVHLDASGADIDASGDAIQLDASASILALAPAIKLDASGAQLDASGNAVAIDASASIVATAPQVKMDASGAQIDASANALALDASASIVAAAPAILLDASGASVDASSNALALDASASIIATAPQVKIDGSGAQVDAANDSVAIDASASIIGQAPRIFWDASGAQVDASSNALALDASGSISLTSASLTSTQSGAASITALSFLADASGAQIDLSGNIAAIDASGAITLSAGAASSFAVASGDLNLSAASDVDLSGATITGLSSGATSFTALSFLADASGAQVNLASDTAAVDASGAITLTSALAGQASIVLSATNTGTVKASSQLFLFDQGESAADNQGVGLIAVADASGSVIPVGALVAAKNGQSPANGRMIIKPADCDSATVSERRVVGVVNWTSIAAGAAGTISTIPGTITAVKFAAGFAPTLATQVGMPVFLSDSAGEATMTAPSNSGDAVVQVGYLVRHTANAAGNFLVLLAPQFIGQIP